MQQQVKLYGEEGTLEIDVPYEGSEAGAMIRVARHHDEQFQTLEVPARYWGDVSRSDPVGVFIKQSAGCRAFIDAILEEHPVTPNFYDGYKAQQVIGAAMDSHRLAKWISVEDPVQQGDEDSVHPSPGSTPGS
jgi:predicted dehydrogenase